MERRMVAAPKISAYLSYVTNSVIQFTSESYRHTAILPALKPSALFILKVGWVIDEARPSVRVCLLDGCAGEPINDAFGKTLFVSRSSPGYCRQVAHCSLKY